MINQRLFDWYGIDTKKNLRFKAFCPRPYDTVLIDKTGSCYLCECTSWLPQSAGNLHLQSLEDIVNSTTAAELQNSIADGSYRYCNTKRCSYLLAKGKGTQHVHFKKTLPNRQIKNIRLAIDDSCNLSCPSCRTHQIFERDKFQLRKKYKLADRIIEYVQSQSHQINIHVGSDGDPFASLVYRYFVKEIKDLPNVRFSIHTNGLLIKKMHHRHTELFKKLDVLNVSIDGATKETYETLRRGGVWEKIIENLEMIKELKKKYNFLFRIHFVIQKDNYIEMEKIIKLGQKYNADRIWFSRIQNWNTYKNFKDYNIFDVEHPLHLKFKEYLDKMENFLKTENISIVEKATLRQLH
jgi:molybdenum cofactor biosynthesis enzyme MoaA